MAERYSAVQAARQIVTESEAKPLFGDTKRVADKYIERGGYKRGERRALVPGDLLTVASFIAWHDDNHMRGGYVASEAFSAFCRLLNFDPIELRKIVRGESS